MKKIFLIIIVFALITLALILLSLTKNSTKITSSPTPIPSFKQTPLPQGALPNNYSGDKNATEEDRRSFLVGQLINKLPIEETHLLLSYDFNKNVFTATVDSSDKNAGLAQLDAVLKTNGIDSRSWINNLEIVYR